jgi:DNA-binding transcriptional regulator YdaS (Cro superfamily)
MSTKSTGLELAIRSAGSMTSLAEKLGVTPQAVAKWRNIPAVRCLDVERITGVSRHVQRPDIYGPEPRRRPLARARRPEHAAA